MHLRFRTFAAQAAAKPALPPEAITRWTLGPYVRNACWAKCEMPRALKDWGGWSVYYADSQWSAVCLKRIGVVPYF